MAGCMKIFVYREYALIIQLLKNCQAKSWLARFSAIYFMGINFWKQPVQDSFSRLETGFQIGLNTGDNQCAYFCAGISIFSRLEIGPLGELNKRTKIVADRMAWHGQQSHLLILNPPWQMMQNLLGLAGGDATVLSGNAMQEGDASYRLAGEIVYAASQFSSLCLCYVLGDNKKAAVHAAACRGLVKIPFSPVLAAMILLYDGLTAIALVRELRPTSPIKTWQLKRRARQCSSRLRVWSSHSPYLFLARHLLLEAELAALGRDCSHVLTKYVNAIAVANESGFVLLSALANERTGMFLLAKGQTQKAQRYLQTALTKFDTWGAVVKSQQLAGGLKNYYS